MEGHVSEPIRRSRVAGRPMMHLPLMGIISRQSGPTTLVYDTFTDTDATALTDHTPDIDVVGGGWVFGLGSATVQSNVAATPAGDNYILIDCGQSDFRMSITVANSASRILFRASDYNNLWLFYPADGTLYERVGGGYTIRATTSSPVSYPCIVSIVTNGTQIDCSFSTGGSLGYSSSTHQTATMIGFGCWTNTTGFDDIEVTTL